MFYDDVRRLKKVHLDALEDSASEVPASLLLEISVLTLRCASKWLSAELSYVWSKADDAWNGRYAVYANFIQNLASGMTHFDLSERREALQVRRAPSSGENDFADRLKLTRSEASSGRGVLDSVQDRRALSRHCQTSG